MTLAAGFLVVLCAGAAPATGYVVGGNRWPGRVITYYDDGPNPQALREAVDIWNDSGVRVSFKPVSRSSADVLVVSYGPPRCSGETGRAQLGYEPQTTALVQLAKCRDRGVAVLTAVHELGHILGLNHSAARCAVMTPSGLIGCKAKPFTERCRYLERDDLRGAISLYGGRAEPLGRALCPIFARPRTPELRISGTQAGSQGPVTATVRVRPPRQLRRVPHYPPPPVTVTVTRRRGACGDATGPAVEVGTVKLYAPGRAATSVGNRLNLDPERYCYSAQARDKLGKVSEGSGSASALVAFAAPVARFTVPAQAVVGDSISPDDRSSAGERGPLESAWDFGDPSTEADYLVGRDVQWTYRAAGTYTITLGVRDRLGRTSIATRTIQVVDPPPDEDPPPDDPLDDEGP